MAMADDLTPRQREILDFIRNSLEVFSVPPTRAEIAGAFGFASPNAAEDHLKALAKKGAITLEPGSARGIRLVEQLGLGQIRIDPALFTPRADFLLRVRGLSMIEAGILDGDLLAVHRTTEASNGQIVIARLGDEVTVKRFKRRGAMVELIAENRDFAPILVNTRKEPLTIEGIAVGLIRDGRTL
ncbi:MAG: transcriptional repressor LexA [Rhodocyclales bacterium]|nr:transcriptional repressor LexA [Rhodocyclales bacterium]